MLPSSAAGAEHHALLHPRLALRQRVRLLNHLVPALILVSGALDAAATGSIDPVRVVEFAVGLAYVLLATREWRALKHHDAAAEHRSVEWLEIAAAGIAALEGYHIWHRHHETALATGVHRLHILPWIYWALSAFYLWLAFNAERLAKRQGLRIDSEGFCLRMLPVSPARRLAWSDLRTISPAGAGGDLWIHRHGSPEPEMVRLSVYRNGAELAESIRRKALEHGIAWDASSSA